MKLSEVVNKVKLIWKVIRDIFQRIEILCSKMLQKQLDF